MIADWTVNLFRTIDRKDADGFVAHLTQDATFQFGNASPVNGRESIREAVRQFFSGIKAVEHKLIETWIQPDAVICRGRVTYVRHDSSRLEVPFANILKLQGDRVYEYLIYVDASRLFAGA